MNSASVELVETVDWILDLYASGPPTSMNVSPVTDRQVCRQPQCNRLREGGERRTTEKGGQSADRNFREEGSRISLDDPRNGREW
jgi:hypothetical protein